MMYPVNRASAEVLDKIAAAPRARRHRLRMDFWVERDHRPQARLFESCSARPRPVGARSSCKARI